MKDLMGQTIRVGDKVAYSVRSISGYLGIGIVVELVPEREDSSKPAGVVPSKLKVEVQASSKYVGAKRGKVITLGNDSLRVTHPKGRLDTVFVYERAAGKGSVGWVKKPTLSQIDVVKLDPEARRNLR